MITVYSAPNCPYCIRAKALLEDRGLNFTEVDIYDSREAASEFVQRTNGAKTVPQILVGEVIIGGFDDLSAKIDTPNFHKLLGDQ